MRVVYKIIFLILIIAIVGCNGEKKEDSNAELRTLKVQTIEGEEIELKEKFKPTVFIFSAVVNDQLSDHSECPSPFCARTRQ